MYLQAIPSLWGYILLMLAIPWSANAPATEPDSLQKYSWTSYFGSHYRQRPWARSIRDYTGPKRAGITFPSDMDTSPGISFNSLNGVDSVITNIGGLDSGRDNSALAAFMSAVGQDGGGAWRKAVKQQVIKYARGESTTGPELYWQFGNEINSEQFSKAFHLWASDGGRIRAHDPSTISWYVEYYLAPGLAAIAEAEEELLLPKNTINIVLGSIAAARNPNAQRWLDMLLEYRIRGDYAQEFEGKHVWELIDIVAIHYLVGTPGSDWESILDCFYEKWIMSGRIQGLWSTEEIGIRKARAGQGAGTAVKVWARYQDWWMKMAIPPDHGKVFFWGSHIGDKASSADGILEELYQFLGDTPLRRLESNVLKDAGGELEYYRFGSKMEPYKQIIVIFPRDKAGGSVNLVSFPFVKQCTEVTIRSLYLGSKGDGDKPLLSKMLNGEMVIRFDRPLSFPYATAAVFMVEGKQADCNWLE